MKGRRRFAPHRHSRRLHLQIFRALVVTGLACLAVASLFSWLLSDHVHRMPRFVQDVAAFIIDDLPEDDARAFAEQLERRAHKLHASISVWNAQGRLVGRSGESLGSDPLVPAPRRLFSRKSGFHIALDDGRTVAIAFDGREPLFHAGGFVLSALLLFGSLLLGSWRAARRITRRLERLEDGITRFGGGDLDARVAVHGADEIARLAIAFNRSFERLGKLVKQQRRMLQSASHELRSPLARVRMALELATEANVASEARERLRSDATRDIEELDALIGDLLLAGRLADTELPREFAQVDLAAIVRSEAERIGASSELSDLCLLGNARMLRSLVRNLLENARRHGKEPIRATLERTTGECVLCVIDAGSGVAAEERERIFEPFYRPAGHREGKDGGVGLGLSLVKDIAEHHGGRVAYVASAEGSCFEVRLPL